jgi:hypothetical protein
LDTQKLTLKQAGRTLLELRNKGIIKIVGTDPPQRRDDLGTDESGSRPLRPTVQSETRR